MNNPRTLAFAAAFVLAGAVHAHDCTGGADGGMDATGNQCNEPIAIAWLGSAHAATDVAPAPYAEGLVAYDAGHYEEALAHFRRAAKAGDGRSAEMLALMLRLGPRLYPRGVPVDTAEAAQWAAVAAEWRGRRAVDPAMTTRAEAAVPH